MKKTISVLLALALILSLCISSASADDIIINLNDEDAEAKIAENLSSDTMVTVMLYPDYSGPDFAEYNAALFERISAVIPSARREAKEKFDRSSMLISIPAGEFIKLKDVGGINDAEMLLPNGELINVIAAEPDSIITVAVDRITNDPLTIEDMPAYVAGDKDSYITARRQLAEINRGLNEAFINELSQYADFEVTLNTNTTIVLLKLKAKDIYALAKCDSVLEINCVSDQKWINHAGTDKLLGDTDGDASVTILDATGIQRELVGLGAAVFDEVCADYDEDGDMTILDATGIQRSLAE